MLVKSPLSLESSLEIIDRFLESLQLVLQAADLAHEGVYLVVLLKNLCLTDLTADGEISIDSGKIFLKVQLRKEGKCLFQGDGWSQEQLELLALVEIGTPH